MPDNIYQSDIKTLRLRYCNNCREEILNKDYWIVCKNDDYEGHYRFCNIGCMIKFFGERWPYEGHE